MNDRDRQIDAALKVLARVGPRDGLELRLRAALRQAREQGRAPGRARERRSLLQRLGMGLAGATAALAIISGSVRHSREIEPVTPPIHLGTGLGTGAGGLGTASAARVPAQSAAVPAHRHGRWQRGRAKGRAELKAVPAHTAGVKPAPSADRH